MFTRRSIVFVSVFMLVFLFANFGQTKELPLGNQPTPSTSIKSSFESIYSVFSKPHQKDEYETNQEYRDRLDTFYEEIQTIYFINVENVSTEYNAEKRELEVSFRGWRYTWTNEFRIEVYKESRWNEYAEMYYRDEYYINALNSEDSVFTFDFDDDDFNRVFLSMTPEEAQENRRGIGVRIGFEFKFNPQDLEGPTDKSLRTSYTGTPGTTYDLYVHLKSVTFYNKETNEIYAQTHMFADDSPVWEFSSEEESDNGSSSSSGCFIGTLIQ